MEFENEYLWQKILMGDNQSFNHLLTNNIPILLRYGLQFTSDRELVKDCIQDVFIKLYETRQQLHHVNNISAYLRTSLKNKIINSLERDKIHSTYISTSELTVVDEYNAEQNMEYLEEEQQHRNLIELIIKALTPLQRKVVRYRYIEGLSLEEISLMMQINYQSVQNILQRSIKKIRKIFLKSEYNK